MKTKIILIFTLIAFAMNSVLGRMILAGELLDPISFTTVRLISGAVVLLFILRILSTNKTDESIKAKSHSWLAALSLFTYAATFSLAYVSLSTGMGALILFGFVQITMILYAIRSGEKVTLYQWLGSVIAMLGLVYLVFPGISAPNPLGALLMGISGIAWGVYSILGKNVSNPIYMTTTNFTLTVPMTIVLSVIGISSMYVSLYGVILAIISGGVTSALGYSLWYIVLKDISSTQASVVQLLVPVIASLGGVIILSEVISLRLILASIVILGGVALAVIKRK